MTEQTMTARSARARLAALSRADNVSDDPDRQAENRAAIAQARRDLAYLMITETIKERFSDDLLDDGGVALLSVDQGDALVGLINSVTESVI